MVAKIETDRLVNEHDRRAHRRMQLAHVEAEVKTRRFLNFHSCTAVLILDISRGGAAIQSTDGCIAAVGDTLVLRLAIGDLPVVEVEAVVRYTMTNNEQCRYGVQFLKLPGSLADHLFAAEQRLMSANG
jgi:c-di-GMP-binding flagellar brake protein YcgR